MTHSLDWTHATTEVGEQGLKRTRAASPEECAALVTALGLSSCGALETAYQIRALGAGRFRLTGTLNARLEQPCVVTLEPIASHLKEPFDVEFHPEPPAGDTGDEERAILGGLDVEVIEGGRINVGRVIFDTLSGSLDPYPRKQGADFDWQDSKAADPANTPFAALLKLKRDT